MAGPRQRLAWPNSPEREPGLRYATDTSPGIRRIRRGSGFTYRTPSGRRLRKAADLERIRALAIPPAWTDVWISPDPRGHIQATGRDARGRKQYRYHPEWRALRDETKFARMVEFGSALPRIRRRVARDLRRSDLGRETVLAAVVDLLDRTLVRIGNPEYARDNGSIGLTTMQGRHLLIEGSRMRFRFTGKGGKVHDVGVRDRRLARTVQRMQDLPGHRLFQYTDDDGEFRRVESGDVNDYLREIAGDEFSAKDFRTWAGSLIVAEALVAAGDPDSDAEAKSALVEAVKEAAEALRNTPAVTRSAYVHPTLVEAYRSGRLISMWENAERLEAAPKRGLSRSESTLLNVLRASSRTGASGSRRGRPGAGPRPARRTSGSGSARPEPAARRRGAGSRSRRERASIRRTARAAR
jgi:DNA topoisomerase I